MARVTLSMDEALASRARAMASSRGESLSRFVADSVELWLGRSGGQGDGGDVPTAPPERSTAEGEARSGGRRSDDAADA